MRAVVLAAGTGSRLGLTTGNRTKATVKVFGKRLIDHLLNFFEIPLFDEIIVVGGFCFTGLEEYLKSLNIPKIKVVNNNSYLKGNIFTLDRGLKEFRSDSFLITNVDHIYPAEMFDKMKLSFSGITAMCDFDRTLSDDDMKVKLNKNGKVLKIDKKLTDYDCGYIGMTYVDVAFNEIYRVALKKTVKEYGDKAVVENVLQLLATEGKVKVNICDLSGIDWYEVDTASDLKKAETALSKNKYAEEETRTPTGRPT